MAYPHLLPRTLAAAGILALLTATACSKKNDPDNTVALPKTQMLRRQEWALGEVTSTTRVSVGGGAPRTELLSVMTECDRDNVFEFYDNGVYNVLANDIKCTTTEPSKKTGTWAFTESESKLVTVLNGQTVTSDVLAVSDTLIQIRGPVTVQGATYTAVSSYYPNRNPVRLSMLTRTRGWRVTGWKYTPATGPDVDRYPTMTACVRDDIYKFSSDFTNYLDDNTSICVSPTTNMPEPRSISGDWTFGLVRRYLTSSRGVIASTSAKPWTILIFTPTNLVITRDAQPTYLSETITLTAQ